MKSTADRIKEGMQMRGMRQADLAEKTGISKGALSSYISGRYLPKQTNTYLIAEALNVNEAWLMGANVPFDRNYKHKSSNKGVKIPILGSVPAGIPIEAIQDIIDYEEIPDTMAALGNYYGLKIKGHSMEPEIHDGDVVIVRQVPDVESGTVAIVMVNGDEATCKKVVKFDSGISLVPINPDFDPMFFSNDEIERKPVRVIGKVEELRRKF